MKRTNQGFTNYQFIFDIRFSCVLILPLLLNLQLSAEVLSPMPVLTGAYDVTKNIDKGHSISSVKYKVDIPFESKEVLSFYNEQLQRKGWSIYVDKGYSGSYSRWQEFKDATRKKTPTIKQLIACWVSTRKDMRAVLALRYILEDKNSQRKDNIVPQEVIFQIMPFKELPYPKKGEINYPFKM